MTSRLTILFSAVGKWKKHKDAIFKSFVYFTVKMDTKNSNTVDWFDVDCVKMQCCVVV